MQSTVDWPRTQEVLPLLQHKWTTPILECLRVRPYRALEIRSELGTSGKVLTQSMRHLADQDVVRSRTIPAQPPGIAYELTDRGRRVVELLDALNQACIDHGLASLATSGEADQPDQDPPNTPPAATPAATPVATPAAVAAPAMASTTAAAAEPFTRPTTGSYAGDAFRRPNTARMYDYLLGGKDNVAVDRDTADKVISVAPFAPAQAVENRRFLMRALRYLTDQGIDQFIDIGSGLPTQRNVHEVVQAINPRAAVVYVDNDPVVLGHARALLGSVTRQATIIDGDLRDPDAILDSPDLTARIDLARPVGVLLAFVLHCLTDEDNPWRITARIRDRTATGSHLVISHICHESPQAEVNAAVDAAADVYRDAQASTPMVPRAAAAIEELFAGLELVEPGLTRLPEWRPELDTPELATPWMTWPADVAMPHTQLCGVGRVPPRPHR